MLGSPRFENYLIFYRPTAKGIEIVRVILGKTRAGSYRNENLPRDVIPP